MGLTLNKSQFVSHVFRTQLNDNGGRKLDFSAMVQSQEDGNGIIRTLLNWGAGITGFLWRVASGILSVFSFSQLAAQIISAVRFALAFDLGSTDAQIDAQIKSTWAQFYGRFGGALGQAAGWFVCGGAVTLSVFKFNKVLALRILQEVGAEAFEEMRSTLIALGQSIAQATLRSLGLTAFKNVRKWLKQPGNPVYQFLPQGLKDAWEKGKPWSVARAVENRIEALPSGWEEFVEEFVEEFSDSCSEAIMVAANAADTWIAEQRIKNTAGVLGPEFVVEVKPNRNQPDEKYLVSGPLQVLKEVIPTTIQERHYLGDKDLGIVFNSDKQDEFIKAEPETLIGYITYRFEDKTIATRPSVKISSFRSTKTGFADVRAAADATGYLYGPFLAVARMSNGRRIKVFAASAELAEARVQALAVLTSAEIVTIDVTQERNGFARVTRDYLKRPVKKILPYRFVLINRKYFTEPIQGAQPSKRGNYLERKWIFDISTAEKPFDWDERIAEILIGPTVANP